MKTDKMNIKIKIGALCLLMLTGALQTWAQIGGNLTPLLYSTHTYSVLMGDDDYTPNWGLYPAGTPATAIEDNSAVPLVNGTDYTIVTLPLSQQVVGGRAFWRIRFDRNIAVGTSYVIGYKETTDDENECLTAVVLTVTVQAAFDIDIALTDQTTNALRCGDESNQLQAPGFGTMQSTYEYTVAITSPATPPGYEGGGSTDYWRFDFEIKMVGRGSLPGKDGTIASVTAEFGTETHTFTAGTSTLTADLQVDPASTTPVTFTIVYNEVPNITQDITFSISGILGAYSEPDIDEQNNHPELNRVSHVLFAMPDVGAIAAWEP